MNTNIMLLLFSVTALLAGCQQTSSMDISKSKKSNIKVTILYPNSDGMTFDMDYYSKKHMPMVQNLLGDAMNEFTIDKGIAAGTPDEAIPYLAIGYLYFDKLSDYQNAFGPNAEQIIGDIPNYTNIQPVVQISEIVQ